jgi:hypothetical protein
MLFLGKSNISLPFGGLKNHFGNKATLLLINS